MGMAVKVIMLLAARQMTLKDLAEKMSTTSQNISAKLKRDNLSERELVEIARSCDASFEGIFRLNDSGKEI